MKPLYPIMAVVVIASAGALPLRARAADGDHPVNALTLAISKKPEARKSAGDRIDAYLRDAKGPKGGAFIAADAGGGPISDVVRKWAELYDAGKVAHLYFVLGPGDKQPDWVDGVLKKSFLPGKSRWEVRLSSAMSKYETTPITKTQEKTQTTAFLGEAADAAVGILNDPRTRAELDADIAKREEPVVVPDTRNNSRLGSQFDGGTRQYTLEDLYQDGAAFGMVTGPKDEGGRKISIKIYSTRGEDGQIYNEIGIFDITDNSDIFGQRFPLNSKTQSFVLDDRTPGHRKYELTFGTADGTGDRTIKFGRPGGTPLETTVTELLKKRADQAERLGNIVNVNGQEFYTLPQGGAKSALAFFPKAMIDSRENYGDPRSLVPALYAETGKRGPDGRNQNFPAGSKGGPHLGKVGDKEFHLEWNAESKAWVIKEGAGDIDKPKPPTTGTGTGTGTGNGDPNNPGGGTGTTPDNTGGYSIDELIKILFEKDPTCKQNPDDLKDLDPSLKTSFSLVVCNPVNPRTNKAEKRHIVLTPKSVADSQQLSYGDTESQGQKFVLQRARFFGHYLVLVFDKQTQYLDLLSMDNGSFAMAGYVVDKNAKNFTDVTIFVDALRNYMGVTGKDTGAFTEVPKRLTSTLNGKKLEGLTGSYSKTDLIVNVTAGGETWMIWPDVTRAGGAGPTSNAYQNINGPGTAMDADQGGVSSADAAFPDTQPIDQSQVLEKVKDSGDIALYKMRDAKPERYFLMFKYEAVDDPKKPAGERKVIKVRQKQFEVFNEVSPLPSGYQMQGLVGVNVVVKDRMQAAMRFVPGSKAEKGALIVVQNKALTGANEQDASTNCAGPIVWWGVDRGAAETACKKNKL